MSAINVLWRKYGLKDNPYFLTPVTIDSGNMNSFIGREKESRELKKVLELGGDARCMVVGEPGVGKTSLVNYVRNSAKKYNFFTPSREIEINRPMTGNELIINTICSLYEEIKREKFEIDQALMENLEALYELTTYAETFTNLSATAQLSRHKLMEIFSTLVKNITHPKYESIIIHYDNLDNIQNPDDIVNLIPDIRDFLLTKKVIFIFVGDEFLPANILTKTRVAQIFLRPAIEVPPLSLDDVKLIINKRLELMEINENFPAINPHKEETIETLFNLHNGNIREILNSLTLSAMYLPPSNMPIQIDDNILRETLHEKAKEKFISKLTPTEKDVLFKVIDDNSFTPSQLAEKSGKSIQNVSSKYIPKFMGIGAVKFKGAEGRNKYYEISEELKWWKLKVKEGKPKEEKVTHLIEFFNKDTDVK